MDTVFIILRIINISLLIGVWFFSFKNYKNLPDKIPIHFNIVGEPDRFSNKKFFYFLPIIATLLLGLFFYLSNFPESANYTVEITPENEQSQYKMGIVFSQIILFFCLLLFFIIQDFTVKYVTDKKPSLANIALPIVGLFLTIMVYTVLSNT